MNSPVAFERFCGGIGAFFSGAWMLIERPRLWGWLLAPLVANVIIVLSLGTLLLTLLSRMSQAIHPHLASADGRLTWWGWGIDWFLYLAGFGLAALVLIVVWKVVELILFGVAYARITESVQRERLAPGEQLKPLSMWHDFVDALMNVMILLAGFALIFLLNFVPVVGNLLSLFLGVLWGAFIQGLDLLGVCRALRGDRRVSQISFCYRHAADTLGLGLIGFIFSFLPIIGPLFVASCAVGAVLVHENIAQRSPRRM